MEVELIAPDRLRDLAIEAMGSASQHTKEDTPEFAQRPIKLIKLRVAMRYDLRGADIPSPEELDRMADIAISNTTTFLAKGDA